MRKVYKSRWGYHPISYEQSKKIRFINGVFAKAQHRKAAWNRWNNKEPQNRVQRRYLRDSLGFKIGTEILKDQNGNPLPWSEPDICNVFYTKIPCEVWSKVDGKWGWHNSDQLKKIVISETGKKMLTILYASRLARMPQTNPETVKDFPITDDEIDDLYEKVKKWTEK